jgi:carotenoid cleavage dioxygenase
VSEVHQENSGNVWLLGNRAPALEERDETSLRVEGELPAQLSGMLLRNGPNPQFVPKGRYHWWDGDGMLHGISIEQGRASYRNRWVRTKGFMAERDAGHAVWRGMMYPPDFANPHGPRKNPSNTNVMFVGGRVLSLWEGGRPHVIRVPSLETQGVETFGGRLKGPMTAHPHRDAKTGEVMFFGSSAVPPYCTYGVIDATGAIVHLTQLDLPAPSLMHDFVFTERYAVICDFPCKLRIERGMRGENPISWEPELGSRFGVIPRRGSQADVRWLVANPGYVFHFANAYEEGDTIVIHGSRMPQTSFAAGGGAGLLAGQNNADEGRLHRFVLNLRTGLVSEQALDDRAVDFVRIHPEHWGRPYRFTYGSYCRDAIEPGSFDHLIKYDHVRNTSEVRPLGGSVRCGDSVFVPHPNASAEDEGWVLALTHDESSQQSELLVVNAQDFTGEAQARVFMPSRVPYGFHAEWLSAAQVHALSR